MPILYFFSGTAAEICSNTVRNPFEVAKQQMQLGLDDSLGATFRSIIKVKGVRGKISLYIQVQFLTQFRSLCRLSQSHDQGNSIQQYSDDNLRNCKKLEMSKWRRAEILRSCDQRRSFWFNGSIFDDSCGCSQNPNDD